MDFIKIFSPATIANISCGFDTLGLALSEIGDTMTFAKSPNKEIIITDITGADISYKNNENVAAMVAEKMLTESKANFGVIITMHKGYAPGSGLGSSGASAAGTAFAINKLLDDKYDNLALTKFAMYGEKIACGEEIADNVAAALYGGFVLVRSYNPLDIIKLPTPKNLRVVAIHPQIEVRTEDARRVLPKEIKLEDAITQWANVGGLVSGLHAKDYDLISRSLQDVIVEPHRKKLIPHFNHVKQAALEAGALGAGISGSGPTIFALCNGEESQNKVFHAIEKSYRNGGVDFELYKSKINKKGIKILKTI